MSQDEQEVVAPEVPATAEQAPAEASVSEAAPEVPATDEANQAEHPATEQAA